ncbi:membrane protein DedA with SNARE-associated domain [Nakamurella flavida]|uniref:DedA family protein n=1 Tax=Nakamurella flavida TaxID=363630 RepID=UPI00277F997A|nr:membrane protein DedA with SNARE-associated domain [Nakamurella flavida]
MPSWLDGRPLPLVFAVLLAIVLARAQLTYWLGRGALVGLSRRFPTLLTGPRTTRATALIRRFGAPVVTVSFLTIGFQTVANAAAGLVRMPFGRYCLAMVPGCIAWAALYATVGLAVVQTAVALAATSPWAVAGVAVAVLAVLGVLGLRRTRRRRSGHEPGAARTTGA